jgi:hypothetical protein
MLDSEIDEIDKIMKNVSLSDIEIIKPIGKYYCSCDTVSPQTKSNDDGHRKLCETIVNDSNQCVHCEHYAFFQIGSIKKAPHRPITFSNTPKKVLCITDGKVFESGKAAAKYYNISQGHISEICNGKRKTAKKLEFVFYNDIKH